MRVALGAHPCFRSRQMWQLPPVRFQRRIAQERLAQERTENWQDWFLDSDIESFDGRFYPVSDSHTGSIALADGSSTDQLVVSSPHSESASYLLPIERALARPSF